MPIDGAQSTKPRKTPAHLRKPQILALQSAGMTQNEIAEHFGVSRATICSDLEELRPAQEQVESKLNSLVGEIGKVITVEQRAKKYARLATSAKNEAVSLGALQRIDDLDGIVTDKEKIRAKASEPQQAQAMFQLPAGASVNVTINQQNNTTYSKDASLHNTPTETPGKDTATYREDDGHGE